MRAVWPEATRCGATAVMAALAWVAASPWPAMAAATSPVVRCESEGIERVHCAMDTRQDIELVRQLSTRSCIRESDWGVDGSGVWVARGCRAEFRARGAEPMVTRHMIRCESKGGRMRSCPVNLRGAPVRLLRQLSALPCREGESWGTGRNEVWASRGCKGEFEIGDPDTGFPPGARLLTCESKERVRRECGTSIERGATLLHQLSGISCVEGENWGWDAHGVWVDDGCRAQFRVE